MDSFQVMKTIAFEGITAYFFSFFWENAGFLFTFLNNTYILATFDAYLSNMSWNVVHRHHLLHFGKFTQLYGIWVLRLHFSSYDNVCCDYCSCWLTSHGRCMIEWSSSVCVCPEVIKRVAPRYHPAVCFSGLAWKLLETVFGFAWLIFSILKMVVDD